MQSVSAAFTTATSSAFRKISYGALISWLKTINPSYSFFTIGTSLIGGADSIKSSSGSASAFFDKYQYSDYSPYVMSMSVSRRMGQYPYGVVVAQADLELDNTSKLFQPGYDATIGNYILPFRPMKLAVGFGSETINMFVGYTQMPKIDVTERKVTLHALDAFDYINSFVSSLDLQVNKYVHEIITALLTEMGFSASQYSIDTSLGSKLTTYDPYNKTGGDILRELVESELGLLFVDENGIIRFWNRQHTIGSTSQWTFDYSNLQALDYDDTPIINDVTVKALRRVVGASQDLGISFNATQVPAGGTVDIFVSFTDTDGDLPVTSVTTPGYSATPIAASYYSTNELSDGSGMARNGNLSISSTHLFGSTYRITFANSFTSPIWITALRLYGTPAKVVDHIVQRYQNQTSIDNYGRNPSNQGKTIEISNDAIPDTSTAYSIAYTIVNEYATPRRRYKVTDFSVPQLQIGDYVTVTIADTSETKIMTVVGKLDKIGRRGALQQELTVEERSLIKYFQIQVSSIAGTDQIAP